MVGLLQESKGWEVLSKARFGHRFPEDCTGSHVSAKLSSIAQVAGQSGRAAVGVSVIYLCWNSCDAWHTQNHKGCHPCPPS